jgi:hypothetical protein
MPGRIPAYLIVHLDRPALRGLERIRSGYFAQDGTRDMGERQHFSRGA